MQDAKACALYWLVNTCDYILHFISSVFWFMWIIVCFYCHVFSHILLWVSLVWRNTYISQIPCHITQNIYLWQLTPAHKSLSSRSTFDNLELLKDGLSGALVTGLIIGVHEIGHILAARESGIKLGVPYFVPSWQVKRLLAYKIFYETCLQDYWGIDHLIITN